MGDDVHFQLGNLSARIKTLEESNERVEVKIDAIRETMNQAVGGIRAFKVAGAIAVTLAGMLGAMISKIVTWVNGAS